VNTVMNPWFTQNVGKILISWTTVGFSGRAQIRAVSYRNSILWSILRQSAVSVWRWYPRFLRISPSPTLPTLSLHYLKLVWRVSCSHSWLMHWGVFCLKLTLPTVPTGTVQGK
jgi:hypothetical protein